MLYYTEIDPYQACILTIASYTFFLLGIMSCGSYIGNKIEKLGDQVSFDIQRQNQLMEQILMREYEEEEDEEECSELDFFANEQPASPLAK